MAKEENEKLTWQDLEYGKKTDKRGKRDTHSRTWNMVRNTEKGAK